MIRSSFLGLALVASAVLAAAPAEAQSGQDERARLHFESGRSYFEEGAYERALQEFEAAYQLSPRTVMLFNLGTTYERLGHLAQAADTFERFLNESAELDNRETLERRVANLRRRIAEGGSNDTSDTNATAATSTGTSGSSDGGGGGGDGLVLGGIIALGVAGVGLISTAIVGGLALSEQSAVEGGCFATRSCTEDDIGSLRTLTLATDVFWIASAVAGATGLVLLVLGITSSGDDSQASIRWNGLGVEGSF